MFRGIINRQVAQSGIGVLTQATEQSGARGVPSRNAVMPCASWRRSAKGEVVVSITYDLSILYLNI